MTVNREIFTPEEALEHVTSLPLAEAIGELVASAAVPGEPVRLYDFGCGNGSYLRPVFDTVVCRMEEMGLEAPEGMEKCFLGVEGTPVLVKRDWPFVIYPVDVSLPNLWMGLPGHTMSLEVGEHIHASKLDAFVDNIARHTAPDGWSVVSWAVRGQGGRRHISCRDAGEVTSMFLARGMRLMEKETARLREIAGDNKFWWFRKSVYVFRR